MRRFLRPSLTFFAIALAGTALLVLFLQSRVPAAKAEQSLPKFNKIATFEFGSAIRTIAFSPDSNRLFAASPYLGKLLDYRSGKVLKIKTVSYPEEAFRNALFSPSGQLLAYSYNGSKESGVGVIDVESWREPADRLIFSDGTPIEKIVFSPDGELLICWGSTGDIRNWIKSGPKSFAPYDATQWELVFRDKNRRVRSIEYSPDGTLLVIGGDYHLSVWAASSSGSIAGVEPKWLLDRASTSLAFSANGRQLYTLDASSRLDALDAVSGKYVRTLFAPNNETQYEHINHFAVYGNHIVSVGGNGMVDAWNVELGLDPASKPITPFGEDVDLRSIAVSPDEKYFAVGTETGRLTVFEFLPVPH